MTAYVVSIPAGAGGKTLVNGANAAIVWSDSEANARVAAAALHGSDSAWSDADVTEVDSEYAGALAKLV
jgi:hypothetical protein